MKKNNKKHIVCMVSIFISILLVIISPGVSAFSENLRVVQNDGAVEITKATFESNTVAKDIINTLQINYKILDKSKLKEGDKIVITLPDIFTDITPVYPEQHFSSVTNENGVVTLTFNKNIDKAVTGYMSIRLTGNNNIRQGVSYPVNINLNGKTETVYVKGEENSSGGSSGEYPLMYKTANLPIAASGTDGNKEYYGEITDRNKPIKYYIEINSGDGTNPNSRKFIRNAKLSDDIPKGMALDIKSITVEKTDYYNNRTDVTQEFWNSGKIKADKSSLNINFGDVSYEHYAVTYETYITSTEKGYMNNANLSYDNDSNAPSKYYSKLSKDAGALNVYKSVDKTNVKNDPNDQKIKYQIKFDSYGHFFKDTLNIVDNLDTRLSDIKITSTNQFTTTFDKATKKLTIKNDKDNIDPSEEAYITIEASMKNVKPGDEVKNVAYVNDNPTNEVITKKNPLVKIIKTSSKDASNTLLEGAIFNLTTKDGQVVKDVYNKEVKTITTSSKEPVTLELPYGEYKLEEVKAPDGYKLDPSPVEFTVGDQSKIVNVVAKDDPLPTTCNLNINKVDEKGLPILGAEFQLVKETDQENPIIFISQNNIYEIDSKGTKNLIPLGNDASFKINNLPYGNYILKEVKSPNGYKLSDDIYITLNSTESYYKVGKQGEKIILNKNTETNIYNISVKNFPRIILPETGGIGTSKFYLIGITLLAGVLILLVSTKFVLRERKN